MISRNNINLFLIAILLMPLQAFNQENILNDRDFSMQVSAKKVELKKIKNTIQLYRNGEPYFIKGASGFNYYNRIKDYGGNSIRTWNTDNAKKTLNEADSLGLTVTLGLFIGAQRFGFDYNNAEFVEKQFQSIKQDVIKYKDCQALLMWGIGNEVELGSTDFKFWEAINDIAKMIHEIDPNHPTTTMLAGVPKNHIQYLKKNCHEIDILSINTFKDLPNVPMKIREAGWKGAYLISEWGATGYWEANYTSWNVFIEETSSEKAELCKNNYESSIKADYTKCIGSYVFLWGTKQERTHTLFSMFLESGKETESVDVMQYLWTGKFPDNRTPQIKFLYMDGKTSRDNIYLKSNTNHTAISSAIDYENDNLTYKWEVRYESTDLKIGTAAENKPEIISSLIGRQHGDKIVFKTPNKEGSYRLYIYIYDTNNNIATANIPFYVSE